MTIFCSSMRKARTMRSRTQLPHLEPPYARWTVFLGFEICEYSRGRRAGICRTPPSQYAIVQLLFPIARVQKSTRCCKFRRRGRRSRRHVEKKENGCPAFVQESLTLLENSRPQVPVVAIRHTPSRTCRSFGGLPPSARKSLPPRRACSLGNSQTLTPGSLMPQSPHLGAVPRFLMWRSRS